MATADDHRLARDLADAAGVLLLSIRAEALGGDASSAAARELGARGDAAAHRLLVDRLAELRPDDAVLSEEATRSEHEDVSRLDADRVWIIDPVDGTREYGEGRTDWAVHVALVEDHVPTAGAVALPGLGITLATDRPPPLPASVDPPRVVVSRTRPPAVATDLAIALDAQLVELGSAGAKVMAVLRGDADVYVHAGGQYEWDSAAPAAVALAAGAHASRIDGAALEYNQKDPRLPDILVCHPVSASTLLTGIREVSGALP